MINTLNRSTGLERLTKTRFLSIVAVTALMLTATLLHADSGENQPEQNTLVGTWLKANGVGGLTPLLTTFMSDGSLISSRCIMIPRGPTSAELVSAGHGTWIRTGHLEFTATTIYLRSGLRSGSPVEFTGLVKTVETFTLNRTSDQLTRIGTTYIYDANNNLLFSVPPTGTGSACDRVVAGQ
jgi:hypothetical protein